MKRLPFSIILNWRLLFMRFIMYALMVLGTAALVPQIYFQPFSVLNMLIVGLTFGVLNAVLRPIIQLLTFSLLFATYGILVILVNTVLLFFLSWIVPIFYVENFWWALVGGAVIGLLGSLLENLFGLTLPILPERDAQLKEELARQTSRVERLARPRPAYALPESDVLQEIPAALPGSQPAVDQLDLEPGLTDQEVLVPDEISEQKKDAAAIIETIEAYEKSAAPLPDNPDTGDASGKAGDIADKEVES